MSRKLPEILTGLAVIVIAALFLVYALGRAQALGGSGYVLSAQFSNIGGLTVGSDVKLGGVVVGHVTEEHLDSNTYAAIVKMRINDDVKLPSDTSAAISSDGLLGGNYIGLSPGGSDKMLAPGQAFPVTQSAINIEDLLGKFIFSMGGDSGKSGSDAGAAPGGAAAGSAGGTSK
ncbi:MAG: outer membrane lipid asymmetry maintenance protein MlaD [Acidocella sp. 20-57-95]|nr:MAG: outer membrane lipid asymmetry maintenance protein MlaD [Acidocella sp. 20-57-95]OYV62333.1 MAG: outer membrane lipid asymmetry maintenance protein MlaD [Acidocella sp. 21-58-7]HQT63229.1 outer membrane lipid asymmetry maintenance protein MlaD [Acidocella sp.]HQU03784.1 outer membrane lipid asymmetry maintenance protein MlaD [Acidocella sp.]